MKISLLVEGDTERALLPHLRRFLATRISGRMPRIDPVPFNGRIPKGEKLKRAVERLLSTGRPPADAVIALTDVYTGSLDFSDATDAKKKMTDWVGPNPHFFPHAAQYDFEAWLLPYWQTVLELAGNNRVAPGGSPESVNHQRPPSKRIKEVFLTGSKGRSYVKPRDADRILRSNDLKVAALACPELKALLNRILELCGGETL